MSTYPIQPTRPVILCVDDEPTNLRFLMEILQEDYQVYLAPSGERALVFLESRVPDLILLDVEMPKLNGYDVIKAIKKQPQLKDIPVIFLTSLEGRDKERQAFDLGAADYIQKPISVGVVKVRAQLQIELESHRKNLEHLVSLRTSQLNRTQDCILDMLANVTSYRDNETGAHIKRTTYYCQAIVDTLREKNYPGYQLSADYANSIVKSAKLHDIGKVAVPDNILLKPDRLTPEEFDLIKLHTSYGAELLDNAMHDLGDTSSFLNVAREIIIGHHEKWDGTGYPYQLAGDAIPLSARIVAIVDVYDAMISRRPYKEPYPHQESMNMVLAASGTHFDPTLLMLCGDVLNTFEQIALEHKDDPMHLQTPLD